jgi:hypothetical protein
MDFDTKASNIILIILKMKVVFQKIFFIQNSYGCLNERPHLNVFV